MDADRLDALLADAVAAEAGRARAAERQLRQAAEESATFAGALVDLAERAEPIGVRVVGGRVHRGVIAAVGRDFLVVRDDANAPVLIALAAVSSVRTVPARGARPDTAGDRPPPLATSLGAVLAGAAADRPLVQLGVTGEDALLLGELRAVGHDVVTLRIDAEARPTLFLPLAAVTEAVLLER